MRLVVLALTSERPRPDVPRTRWANNKILYHKNLRDAWKALNYGDRVVCLLVKTESGVAAAVSIFTIYHDHTAIVYRCSLTTFAQYGDIGVYFKIFAYDIERAGLDRRLLICRRQGGLPIQLRVGNRSLGHSGRQLRHNAVCRSACPYRAYCAHRNRVNRFASTGKSEDWHCGPYVCGVG